jgi:hypothetical protein
MEADRERITAIGKYLLGRKTPSRGFALSVEENGSAEPVGDARDDGDGL